MRNLYIILFSLALTPALRAQEIPGQFILQWEDYFKTGTSRERYNQTGSATLQLSRDAGTVEGLNPGSADSLSGIGLKQFYVGDFVMHLNLTVPSEPPETGDWFVIQFARKDTGNFYRMSFIRYPEHLLITLDAFQQGTFTRLESLELDPSFIPVNQSVHIGLRHDILEGSISLWVHKASQPILKVMSRKLVLGGILFQSTGRYWMNDLKIYAPTLLNELYE